MASKNVGTLRAAHESWNQRDFDGVVRNAAEGLVYTDNARAVTYNNRDKFREWRERSSHLAARAMQTDLLGSLALASQLFRDDRRNVLVVFSDMRHYTRALDLEKPNTIKVEKAMALVQGRNLIPSLKGVEVYVLGADGAGKTLGYWQGLRDFWAAYFQKAGANLHGYSVLRELPALQ